MDGQQLDLILRHQGVANICDSEVPFFFCFLLVGGGDAFS
jgi:hypothetical protein